MIVAQLAVRCDECLSAQEAGWATRRNHGGRDLCAAHRIEAAA